METAAAPERPFGMFRRSLDYFFPRLHFRLTNALGLKVADRGKQAIRKHLEAVRIEVIHELQRAGHRMYVQNLAKAVRPGRTVTMLHLTMIRSP